MSISKASSSLVIQPDHILLAHQIYDYSHEHEDTSEITAAVRELIRYIILTYPEESQKTSSRSTSRSRSVEFTKYPEDWIITKSARQAAFRKFREQTNHYRQHPIFLKYLHTRHSERPIRSDHGKGIDREHTESVDEEFFRPSSQRRDESSASAFNTTTTMTPEIQNAINEAIRQYALANPPVPGPPGPPGPSDTQLALPTGSSHRWNASEVGFFDPMYDGKSVRTGEAMEHAGKDTYFRDVHLFIERAKDISMIQKNQHVRDNLFTCLRGSALQWYISEISTKAKQLIRYDEDIDHWTTQLLRRFKESIDVFIDTILKKRYTMNDARRHREPREYVVKILRAVKFAELESMTNQMTIIYNELDVEFRRDMTKSSNVLFIDSFLREMNDAKEIWWQLAIRAKNIDTSKRDNRDFKHNEDFNRAYFLYFRSNAPYRNHYTNNVNPQYRQQFDAQSYHFAQNQFQTQTPQRSQVTLSTTRQSLTITNTSSASSQSFQIFGRYNQARNESRPYRPKVYQATVEDENEENEDTNMKAVPVNFAGYDEQGNELYYDEQLYEDDSNEAFVGFVEMKYHARTVTKFLNQTTNCTNILSKSNASKNRHKKPQSILESWRQIRLHQTSMRRSRNRKLYNLQHLSTI